MVAIQQKHSSRDLRIVFFRGFALLNIIADHIDLFMFIPLKIMSFKDNKVVAFKDNAPENLWLK